MRMPMPSRKSPVQRFLGKLTDPLERTSGIRVGLPSVGSNGARARKAGLIAGAVVGLTAGSAGISSLRRRNGGAREDS